MLIFAKFHKDRTKNVDFLLVANFWKCLFFFLSLYIATNSKNKRSTFLLYTTFSYLISLKDEDFLAPDVSSIFVSQWTLWKTLFRVLSRIWPIITLDSLFPGNTSLGIFPDKLVIFKCFKMCWKTVIFSWLFQNNIETFFKSFCCKIFSNLKVISPHVLMCNKNLILV